MPIEKPKAMSTANTVASHMDVLLSAILAPLPCVDPVGVPDGELGMVPFEPGATVLVPLRT